MVISFVSAGTSARAPNGNVTPVLPFGWAENDIFICIIISKDNVNSTMPSGWTAIDSGTNNGDDIRTSVFYRRAIAGDVNTLVTHQNGDNIVASISAYRGVITTESPLDVVGTTTVNSHSEIVRANSITTLTDGACVIFTGGIDSKSNFSSFSGIPTPIERLDTPYQGDYPSEFLSDFILNTAGTTGNRTCIATREGVSNGLMFALKPVPIISTSTVIFITDPSDANIYVDGILQITNTSSSFTIQAGDHTVTFTKAGYMSNTQMFTAIASQTITIGAILQPISNIVDSGIVICTSSSTSSCPTTPISCPVQITPLDYVNFLVIINSTQEMTVTIRFLYYINDVENYTDTTTSLIVGTNVIYAFPVNVTYSPNAVISLYSVTLI